MERKNVTIPSIGEEVRIGFSFNYLIKVIAETEANDIVQWDFSGVSFLHPFFLAPLAIYKNTSGKDIECVNMSLRVQAYLNSVCFDRMLHFENDPEKDIENVMNRYLDKSFIPLCSFSMTNSNKDTFGSLVHQMIVKQSNVKAGGRSKTCSGGRELLFCLESQ